MSNLLSRRQSLLATAAGLSAGLLSSSLLTSDSLGAAPAPFVPQDLPPRLDLDDLYDAQVDAAVRNGLSFLISRQNDDGSFQSSEQGQWVGVCALAGLAFLSRGVRSGVGEAGIALQKTGKYVLSRVQASGFLSAKGETSHGPMYDHGFGTLFLAELLGTDRTLDIRPKLSSAVRLIVNTQNDQGGWRYNP